MRRRKLFRIARVVWIAAGITATAWLVIGFQAWGVPEASLHGDSRVAVVQDEDGIYFQPLDPRGKSALIFLPGGMVDPVAYVPLLRNLAGAGHRCYLMKLPWRCACTESQIAGLFAKLRAKIGAGSDIAWLLAGHSRGGMLASRFAHESPELLTALALMGTTHPRDFDLSGLQMRVAKIYGTRDGIAPYESMRANAHLLPPHTSWVRIEGGNHVQFGYYRHQFGDDTATISRTEQQEALRKALSEILAFME